MKNINKNLKNTLVIGSIVPLIAISNIYVNAQTPEIQTQTPNVIEKELPFAEMKKDILQALQEELNYTTNKKAKTQISQSFETLKKIDKEKDFYATLDGEYKKIDTLMEIENPDETAEKYDFSKDKPEILKEIQKEISHLKDKTFAKTFTPKIAELSKINTENAFFEKLDTIYQTLDTYYEKNNIVAFGSDDMDEYNFSKMKKDIVNELKERMTDEVSKKEIKKLEKIENEDEFYNALDVLEWYYDEEMIVDFETDRKFLISDENVGLTKAQKETLSKIEDVDTFYETLENFYNIETIWGETEAKKVVEPK